MKILRWTLKLHKWIALLIGLQIFAWVLGGLIFSILDIEKVRGEHKIREWTVQPFDPARIIPLETATEKAGIDAIKSAELGTLLGRPVWRVSVGGMEHTEHDHVMTLDGRTGNVLSPIDEALAIDIAKGDYNGPGTYLSIEYVTEPPTEYPHPGAAWVASFDDSTTLYINPDSAEVKSRRSNTWRIFDFFWKLHVMDYDDGENFNHPLLIISAAIALIVVLSGFVLLFIRMRHLIRSRRKTSQEA